MLSLRTERLLAQFLLSLSHAEQRVETMRDSLASLSTFTPSGVFALLDPHQLISIGPSDFMRFAVSLGVPCTEVEAVEVIKQYDSNADGRWNEADFVQFVLPAANPIARARALDRQGNSFPREVSLTLARLISLEFSFHREVRSSAHYLHAQSDFSLLSAFKCVSAGRDYVTRSTLRELFVRAYLPPSEANLDAVFRRLDTDGDERLSFAEFAAVFADCKREEKPLRNSRSLRRVQYTSPYYEGETERPSVATLRSFPRSHSRSGSRSSAAFEEALLSAPLNAASKAETAVPVSQTSALVAVFAEKLRMMREGDTKRRELILDVNFSLEDVYLTFDPSDKGYLTPSDLESGLLSLGVLLHPGDSRLLISEYSSTTSQARLSFADFCEMLLPLAPREYDSCKGVKMTQGTKARLADLMQTVVDAERRVETHRQALARLPSFNAAEAFSVLDSNGNGQLSVSELREFLARHKVYAGEREVTAVLACLDRDKDGAVTSREFVQALAPKSVEKC